MNCWPSEAQFLHLNSIQDSVNKRQITINLMVLAKHLLNTRVLKSVFHKRGLDLSSFLRYLLVRTGFTARAENKEATLQPV